jgi:hypothetical protein
MRQTRPSPCTYIYSTLELEGADDVSDMESVALRDVRTSHASHHTRTGLPGAGIGHFGGHNQFNQNETTTQTVSISLEINTTRTMNGIGEA